ncbi:Na+/H+-dicarboxylate symporter [Amycolatopsis bartoniae]|uniref:Sodium:proton antiporter n=1 Tax=Amycolatopsis bartoniae TaxID=941986 RepID=A0A8H9MEM0_9PSEU|nr:dicarboxylate/amino acid:cation symporter [Amycolatopsis bartoniae]MBB2937380.1 Na+/H+-dicarboxylate symporter [Amycolatopsis bartoniae]TVT01623.1 dicarboxylate/amino acid:cation symporter [Amycolatopsis bartoniae]GHF78579.1 sodium:proton antiporter [Amycolatopsis bartoniae]
MSLLRTYRKPKVFGLVVVVALVVGALLGFLARQAHLGWLNTTLNTIGSIFTDLLQVTVLPLVFTAIVLGIVSLRGLGGARTAARLGGKTVLWFATTSFIAVLIGIAVGRIVNPGSGVSLQPDQATVQKLASRDHGSWLDLVDNLVPSNLFEAFAEGKILQVVVISLAVGLAAYSLGDRAEPFVRFNRVVFDLVQKVLGWIIRLAPIGVLGLIGHAFATYGDQFVRPLLSLIVAVYAGTLLVLFGVYPLLLRFVGKVSPALFFRKAWTALQFAFVSRSSGATLPLSRQTAVNLGVDPGYASFAVPLGTTTKMDGCAAVYPAVASIFIANLFGIHLGFGDYVLIVVVAVFGAIATAGVTGWFTMLTLTLSTLDLPPAVIATGIAVIYGIDPILDMMRTATNVAGQIAIPTWIARTENLLDDEILHSHTTPPLLGEPEPEREPVRA